MFLKYCQYIFLLAISFLSAHSDAMEDVFQASPASFEEPTRLLLLDGDDGTVACRIYGTLLSATIPRFSENWTLESATRSLLRMTNLTAVRGERGASMIGPIDYLGNLEAPHKHLYTIENDLLPVFYKRPISDENQKTDLPLKKFDDSVITTIKAHWISGYKTDLIEEKHQEYDVAPKHLRQSLFINPGLLEIDCSLIELKHFDPRGIDLSSFKARLVDHSIPFQITKRPLPTKDDYRLVTYLYEPLYADWQVQKGAGLFLEKHSFSQTITPVAPTSGGFVVLARTNQECDELELIGLQIPYGHTLIIEEQCIHGDTTLNGLFLMGMTSDHTTMRTANTVFLKNFATKKNVGMALIGAKESEPPLPSQPLSLAATPPYVIYKDASESDRKQFRDLTTGKNFIFTPFSREYWRQ